MFQEYSSASAHGRSPLQIVVMLYDNALASMKAGKAAIAAGDSHRRDFQIERSEQIMTALMNCLDVHSGEMAVDLRALYCYVLNELSEARGINAIRDQRMIQTLAKEMQEGNTVLAVVGASHVVMQQPALPGKIVKR